MIGRWSLGWWSVDRWVSEFKKTPEVHAIEILEQHLPHLTWLTKQRKAILQSPLSRVYEYKNIKKIPSKHKTSHVNVISAQNFIPSKTMAELFFYYVCLTKYQENAQTSSWGKYTQSVEQLYHTLLVNSRVIKKR